MSIAVTIVEGALILGLKVFDVYGLVLGIFAVVFTIAEGFLVWKTNNPISGASIIYIRKKWVGGGQTTSLFL